MTWCLYILATACMSIFQGSQTFQKVINLTKFLIISSGIFQGQYIILIRISHIPLLFIITFNLLSEFVYLHTYREVILRVVCVVYRCLVGISISTLLTNTYLQQLLHLVLHLAKICITRQIELSCPRQNPCPLSYCITTTVIVRRSVA